MKKLIYLIILLIYTSQVSAAGDGDTGGDKPNKLVITDELIASSMGKVLSRLPEYYFYETDWDYTKKSSADFTFEPLVDPDLPELDLSKLNDMAEKLELMLSSAFAYDPYELVSKEKIIQYKDRSDEARLVVGVLDVAKAFAQYSYKAMNLLEALKRHEVHFILSEKCYTNYGRSQEEAPASQYTSSVNGELISNGRDICLSRSYIRENFDAMSFEHAIFGLMAHELTHWSLNKLVDDGRVGELLGLSNLYAEATADVIEKMQKLVATKEGIHAIADIAQGNAVILFKTRQFRLNEWTQLGDSMKTMRRAIDSLGKDIEGLDIHLPQIVEFIDVASFEDTWHTRLGLMVGGVFNGTLKPLIPVINEFERLAKIYLEKGDSKNELQDQLERLALSFERPYLYWQNYESFRVSLAEGRSYFTLDRRRSDQLAPQCVRMVVEDKACGTGRGGVGCIWYYKVTEAGNVVSTFKTQKLARRWMKKSGGDMCQTNKNVCEIRINFRLESDCHGSNCRIYNGGYSISDTKGSLKSYFSSSKDAFKEIRRFRRLGVCQ